MSLSRRRFLEVGGLVAASSAVPLEGLAANATKGVANLAGVSQSDFLLHYSSAKQLEAFVGSTFLVEAGLGRPLLMELASVNEFPALQKQDGAAGESFALNFRLRRGSAVPQGTYVFEHEKLGRGDLLVVPAQSKPAYYTAVINHRRPA